MRRSGLAPHLVVLLAAVAASPGCGDEVIFRPLILNVVGLSSRAETLVVKIIPGGSPDCQPVALSNVASIPAAIQLSWQRDSGAPFQLSAPPVEDERVTIIAYGVDAAGVAIQFACVEVGYLDIESPEIEITLSRVM